MRNNYTKAYKIKILNQYKKSGLAVSEICTKYNIPLSTFHRWKNDKTLNSHEPYTFGEIILSAPIHEENNNYNNTENFTLITSNIEIHLKSGYSKKLLKSYMEAILID